MCLLSLLSRWGNWGRGVAPGVWMPRPPRGVLDSTYPRPSPHLSCKSNIFICSGPAQCQGKFQSQPSLLYSHVGLGGGGMGMQSHSPLKTYASARTFKQVLHGTRVCIMIWEVPHWSVIKSADPGFESSLCKLWGYGQVCLELCSLPYQLVRNISTYFLGSYSQGVAFLTYCLGNKLPPT